MESEQEVGSFPAKSQSSVRTRFSSRTRGAPTTRRHTSTRFDGEGVRYKAKLIGVDTVCDAQGEKMCWDSMMKLKGFEEAARKQGKHKQRVWLKVSSSGMKIMDEKTGALIHDHDQSRISSVKKDESDPRALAYIYQHQNTYSLFYIKMANLADPVLADIEEVRQVVDQETPLQPAEEPTQTSSLLLLSDILGHPAETTTADELMDVFSIQTEVPAMSSQSPCSGRPESPQPKLSSSQILSMFPDQPVGASPYSSAPYSPTTIPRGYQWHLENQGVGPALAPWPTVPGCVPAWTTTGSQIEAHRSQPGIMSCGSKPVSPTAVNGYPTL